MVAVADVKDFPETFGAVPVLHEILRECDGVRSGDAEVRAEILDAERGAANTSHERVAGGRTDGLLAVGVLKDHPAAREPIDVRRLNEFVAIAAEHWLQIVDGNE